MYSFGLARVAAQRAVSHSKIQTSPFGKHKKLTIEDVMLLHRENTWLLSVRQTLLRIRLGLCTGQRTTGSLHKDRQSLSMQRESSAGLTAQGALQHCPPFQPHEAESSC